MIKEPKKKKKRKTKKQILYEYLRTIAFSFLIGCSVAVFLTLYAREEMIKNLHSANFSKVQTIDKNIAKQLLTQTDLVTNPAAKNFSLCMYIGNLYETAGDYENAQTYFEHALNKAPKNNYSARQSLVKVLVLRDKVEEAEEILNSTTDLYNRNLINYKTRSYITLGDKYYSIGKFLKAAKKYETAKFYYDKFSKKDKVIENSIANRIKNSYIKAADIIVRRGYNSDAVKYLHKAETIAPDDFDIKYKIAIIYADLDPQKSVKYFAELAEDSAQFIDFDLYSRALIKSANIAELEGKNTLAKYYRYKIHSNDLLLKNKIVMKDDVEVIVDSFEIKKVLFHYNLKGYYRIINNSPLDIYRLNADFILKDGEKVLETVSVKCVDKDKPLFSNGGETGKIQVTLGRHVYTRKELKRYTIEIKLYKDDKFKTPIYSFRIPESSFYSSK